jgi:hypothetical protein
LSAGRVNGGGCPIYDFAYSRDSSRLAAVDSSLVAHVFRASPEFAKTANSRLQPEWMARLETPQISSHKKYGRFRIVRFGDGEFRVYDLLRMTDTKINSLFGYIIGVGILPDTNDYIVITDKICLGYVKGK